MPASRLKSFNYAVGMFGTSIPINMLKTYAAYFYVDMMGLTTKNVATILFIYTFIDAIDNPVYGFFSDRTRTRWGRRRPWLVVSTPLMVLGPSFLQSARRTCRSGPFLLRRRFLHLYGHPGFHG